MKFNYGSIWKMSYPLIFSLLIQQLIGITDVIYLERVSEVALAGSALGSTYFFTILLLRSGSVSVRKLSWRAATVKNVIHVSAKSYIRDARFYLYLRLLVFFFPNG